MRKFVKELKGRAKNFATLSWHHLKHVGVDVLTHLIAGLILAWLNFGLPH